MGCIYRAENCKNNFKIVGQIIFKKEKEKRMTWQLMWCNVRAVALNATFQLLVLYRLYRYRYRLYDILVVVHTKHLEVSHCSCISIFYSNLLHTFFVV